jgi:hypothetical protein
LEEKNSKIVSTKDLGNGRKEVTFSVDSNSIESYLSNIEPAKNERPDDFKIGTGSVVLNRYDPSTRFSSYKYQFTSNDLPYTQAMKTPTDPHKKIQLAVELYFKEPVVGTVIDLMVDLSSSGFTNDCEDQDIRKLYDKWAKEINLQTLLQGIFLEYYRSGNVTIYRNDNEAKVKKNTITTKKTTTKEYSFPSGYTILNPMNVYVIGSLLFDQEIVQLRMSNEIIQLVNDGTTPIDVLAGIPDDMIKAVRSGTNLVTLNPELTSRITRKKQPYERYASPFLERVFEAILFKQKLRMMDVSTIEGLINQLITVTVGNDEFPATDDDLTAIAELFQTPNKAYTIFWNHTLVVKFHKPEGLDTLTAEKYSQVNDDIMVGLGVSRVLLDGQGANFSTAWVSILSLIERLDNTREKVKDWLEGEYKRIADENGFKTYPSVRFNKMNLREDTYIRDVLLAMYDRGLIDPEDLLSETGRDYQAILEMKKRNEKNDDLFLPPEQPFQGNQTSSPNSGRPTGSGGNYKKRKTGPVQNNGNPPKAKKSKATAYNHSLEEDYKNELQSEYDSIQESISSVIESNSQKDPKILKILIASSLFTFFNEMTNIGINTINNVFDNELLSHSSNNTFSSYKDMMSIKKDLANWNESYINKLSHDISESINLSLESGNFSPESIKEAFSSNEYRVTLIAQSGVLESLRQAKIKGSSLSGKLSATWIAHMDEKTCGICKGLHGTSFAIENIPSRPHSGCRCDLEFN